MAWCAVCRGLLHGPCPKAHALSPPPHTPPLPLQLLGRFAVTPLTAALLMNTTMSMETSARTSIPSCSSEGRW